MRDLNLESRRLFTELAEEFDFGLETRGLLMLCDTAKGLEGEAQVAAEAAEIGVKARVLTAEQAAAADPGVTMKLAGAVLWEQDCHLDPARFVDGLRRKVISMPELSAGWTILTASAPSFGTIFIAASSFGSSSSRRVVNPSWEWTRAGIATSVKRSVSQFLKNDLNVISGVHTKVGGLTNYY